MMSTFFGGMAGFSIGALVETSGWTAVFGLWGVLPVSGIGLDREQAPGRKGASGAAAGCVWSRTRGYNMETYRHIVKRKI